MVHPVACMSSSSLVSLPFIVQAANALSIRGSGNRRRHEERVAVRRDRADQSPGSAQCVLPLLMGRRVPLYSIDLAGNPVGSVLHRVDVELLHGHHGLHGPARPLRVRVTEYRRKIGWHDLPAETVAILQPSAGDLLPAIGESFPVVVNLLVGCAIDHERDRLIEAVVPWTALAVPCNLKDPGVWKDRQIELDGLLGLVVEPQERGDLPHCATSDDLSWPTLRNSVCSRSSAYRRCRPTHSPIVQLERWQ